MKEFFWSQIKKRKRIIRYLISGSTATGVNLFLLYALTEWLGFWYMASAIVAFIGGFLTSFFLQKLWTFQNNGQGQVKRQMALYSLITGINLLGNMFLLYVMVDIFRIWYVLSQAAITALIAFWNYNAFRLFVFKPVRMIDEQTD